MVPSAKNQAKVIKDADGILRADVDQDDRFITKARRNVARFLEMRLEGKDRAEIAQALGVSSHQLNVQIRQAVKDGWLVFTDPLERFQEQIVPKVVDNIDHFIGLKDKQMTIEAAKGAGIFKSHQAIKTETDAPPTILALKIETSPATDVKVETGAIMGVAREAE